MSGDASSIRNARAISGRDRLWWWLLGVAVLALLGFLVDRYFPWLVFGLFVYYVARPITRRLERYVAAPSLVAGLTLLLIVVPFVAVLGATVLVALGQLVAAVAELSVEGILAELPLGLSDLPDTPAEVYDTTVVLIQEPSVQTLLGSIGGAIGAVGAALFNLFIALLIAFFLLVYDRAIADWFASNVFGEDGLAVEYLSVVDRGLRSIYFGYTMTIFAVVVLSAIVYTLFNALAPGGLTIPSAVLFAVVTGLITLVPVVGRSVVYVAIAGWLAAQALTVGPRLLWVPIAFLAVMVVGFDTLVRTYVRPYLSGRLLDTGLVMFAYLLGPPLFGWSGIFVGPFLMVFVVTFVRVILPLLADPERAGVASGRDRTLDEFAGTGGDREDESASENGRGSR